jgi:hypothetical protein
MIHPDSPAEPKRWIAPALAVVLLLSFGLRTWDASQGLSSGRYFDERYTFRNISAILKHGDFRPRNAFYLSLSYLPQTAVLAASQSLYRATRYAPFSVYGKTSDGYSPTAYWLCRMVSVSYGVLSLWLLFFIGCRIHSPETGLLAAAILAALPQHVLSSAEVKPDILVLLLVALTFYWTLGAALSPRLARFLLVGFGVGLAVSAKYTGIAAAMPVIAAVLAQGRRDRRQWLWLSLAGLASLVTFIVLNPHLRLVLRFIPFMVHNYGARGTAEQSGHWVVFVRQIEFLIEQHGPIVAALAALGVAGMLWRLLRPAVEDPGERRLGFILVLGILVGYSLLHALGLTLFRRQNYLPVAPFSSLAAAWAVVELWRAMIRRAPELPLRPLATPLWLAAIAVLVAQQVTIVYMRVVPTNFTVASEAVIATLEPLGLRHVVYEKGLGTFDLRWRTRQPLVNRVARLSAVEPVFLNRADVEIFAGGRLAGPEAEIYRKRVARLPESQVRVVSSRPFQSRGAPVVVLRHLWRLDGEPLTVRVRRPEGTSALIGRLPEGIARPGDTVSLVLWVPRESENRKTIKLVLDPGGREVLLTNTGRRLSRYFRMSPRFQLRGEEVRVRIAASPQDRPRGFGLEIYRWRPEIPPSP